MTDASLTPTHVRAARALLDWRQPELAARSGLTERTVRNFEAGRQAHDDTEQRLRAALVAAGVRFLFDDGPGVQLVTPDPS